MINFWSVLGYCCLDKEFCQRLEDLLDFEEAPQEMKDLQKFRKFLVVSCGVPLSRWDIKEFERVLKSRIQGPMKILQSEWRRIQLPEIESQGAKKAEQKKNTTKESKKEDALDLESASALEIEEQNGIFRRNLQSNSNFYAAVGLCCVDMKFRSCLRKPEPCMDMPDFDLRERQEKLMALLDRQAVEDAMNCITHRAWDPPISTSRAQAQDPLNLSNCSAASMIDHYLHIHQPKLEQYLQRNRELFRVFVDEGILS